MRMRSTIQFVLFLLVLFNVGAFLGVSEILACSVQMRVHPTSDNIPTITDANFILRPPGDILERGTDFYSSLALTDTVIIGVAEGERHEMLGSVADIEVDADGRIFVLDHELGEVLLYSSDGSYLGFFGGQGEGPGELHQPRELALSESGRKAVVFSLNHIQVFERQENGQFLYRNSFPYSGTYGCVMNDHIYVLKYYPSKPGNIQKLTMEGERVASFGYEYQSKSEFVKSTLSGGHSGRLACSERHGVVGMILERIPVLHGYSEDGELLWRVKFEGIKPSPVEETDGGRSLTYKAPSKGDAYAAYLFVDEDGDGEYFNLTYLVRGDIGKVVPFHYYRVDVRTGRGQYVGHAPALRARHRDFVIQNFNSPYPILRILHFDGE